MAQYKPSFVDLSGMSQGIAQGMQQAMQIKQQTDSMVEQRLNEFEKNYNPTKLRAQDLPAFTTAFQNYKQSALRYSRLNRGGAKPEEISVANELKDRSLNEMNNLYSKSSMANQFLAERNDYRRLMAQRGYETPEEVNAQIMQLSTSPANEIDFKALTSPYDIDLKPNTRDLAIVSKAFKDLPKSIEEDVEETQDFDVPGFGKAKVRVIGRYKRADFEDTLNTARMQLTIPRIANYVKDDYEELVQGFNLPDDVADPQLAVIKIKAQNKIQDIESKTGMKISRIEDIKPELLLAYNMGAFSKQRVGYRTDRDELNAAFKAQGIKMSQQRFDEMVKNNTNIQNNRLFGQAMQAEKFGYKKEQDKNKGGKYSGLLRANRKEKK
jgi:hypothetical protein